MKKKGQIAQFGNVQLVRVYCKDCKTYTFVKSGVTMCCEAEVQNIRVVSYKVVVQPRNRRALPLKKDRKRIVASQGGRCIYCQERFGSLIWSEKRKKPSSVVLQWDHFTPFSYSMNNQKGNFVAACGICNRIKSNNMFESIDEATKFILEVRKNKGY